MAEEGGLSSRRPRRSTAGNRMELALAELALEETPEVEDDADFINDRDEEDVFESDFMSTDEEAAPEDHAGDKEVQEAERRERKAVRARVEKATAIAHARQRATFDPGAAPSVSKSSIQKSRRRVSLGPVVNAETGEVIEGTTSGATVMTVGVKRKSQRRHTVMSTTATATRMKDAEEKKAALPKKQKIIMSTPTQDELIARALDTEEGNILEHRNYLQLEEEKRARARVVRQSITGPVLRWISRKEQTKEAVQLEQPPRMYVPYYNITYPTGVAVHSATASGITGGPFVSYVPPVAEGPPATNESTSNIVGVPTPNSSSAPQPSVTNATIPRTPTPSTTFPPTLPQSSASTAPPQPLIEERTMDVCRNYVIHELTQAQSAKKPLWVDTMSAMFGDHVVWGDLRVYTGKNRPFSRPVRICPITGLPARYLDPRTNVPFASVAAFHTLTKVLSREYTWSESLGCYITPGAVTPPSGASSEEPERSTEKHEGEGSEQE